MKTIIRVTGFIFLMIGNVRGQQINHATIDSIKVTYLAVEQTSLSLQNDGIKAIPQATVSLKTGSITVSKVYFKIRNVINDSLLYEVNYTTNNYPQLNNEGFTLFQNNNTNTVLIISPGELYTLKPYKYEVTTEDSSQNQQTVFSVIQ